MGINTWFIESSEGVISLRSFVLFSRQPVSFTPIMEENVLAASISYPDDSCPLS